MEGSDPENGLMAFVWMQSWRAYNGWLNFIIKGHQCLMQNITGLQSCERDSIVDLILVWVALSKILSSDFNVWSGDEEMVGSCVG